MTLNRLIGSEPLEVKVQKDLWNERVILLDNPDPSQGYQWKCPNQHNVLIRSIEISLQAAAGGGGRLPYWNWSKNGTGQAGSPQVGWYGVTNATAAGASGHYTWSSGMSDSNWTAGGTFETHGLPDTMTLTQGEYLQFILLNGALADDMKIKIFYLELN